MSTARTARRCGATGPVQGHVFITWNQASEIVVPHLHCSDLTFLCLSFIVMPQAGDSSDDFAAELDAIEDTESESGNDEQDNEFDARSELDTLRTVLTIPQPDAPMHEVRKVSLLMLPFSWFG